MSEQTETPEEKRAPVQGENLRGMGSIPYGTIAWSEHLEAYERYSASYGTQQSADRIAERAGFGFLELCCLLGRPPSTWRPVP